MAGFTLPCLGRVLVLAALPWVVLAAGNLDVQAFPNGSFSVSVGGRQWFRSGPVASRDLGQWWSQEDGSLELTSHIHSSGVDNVGSFTSDRYSWRAIGSSSLSLVSFITVYDEFPAVAFNLVFNKATKTNTSTASNSTISTYPSFVIEELPDLERGYVTWSGDSELCCKTFEWKLLVVLANEPWPKYCFTEHVTA